MSRILALIDGEHYPPVVRFALSELSKDGDVCVVDYARCVGCGVCMSACPVEAMVMERRPEGEVDEPPRNLREWMALRAEERGLSENDVF